MKNRTIQRNLRILAGAFLMCLVVGVQMAAVAHGYRGFRENGIHGRGFHGDGWYGRFHYPHLWGGFFIGSEWFWGPTVVVEGVPYYCYSGIFYTPMGEELVPVQPPLAQAQTEPANTPAQGKVAAAEKTGDTVTVNIPEPNGEHTPVKLIKTEKGYVGPQGEFYPDHPTVAEFKALYGK
jgi:hypothetical protein